MLPGDKLILSFIFCQISSVYSKELVLSRLAYCEQYYPDFAATITAFFFFIISSYRCRIKRKNSSCSACRHQLQDLTHLLLDCPASEPLQRAIFGITSSIFDFWSRFWDLARLLDIHGIPPSPITHFCFVVTFDKFGCFFWLSAKTSVCKVLSEKAFFFGFSDTHAAKYHRIIAWEYCVRLFVSHVLYVFHRKLLFLFSFPNRLVFLLF